MHLKWHRQSPLPLGRGGGGGGVKIRNHVGWRSQSHRLSLSSLRGRSHASTQRATLCQTRHISAAASFCGDLRIGCSAHTVTGHPLPGTTWRSSVPYSGSFCACAPRGEGHTLLSLDSSEMASVWSLYVPVALAKGSASFPSQASVHNWPAPQSDRGSTSAAMELLTSLLACPGYRAVDSSHQFCVSCLLRAEIGASPRRERPPLLGLPFPGTFHAMNGRGTPWFQRKAVTAWLLGQCSGRGQGETLPVLKRRPLFSNFEPCSPPPKPSPNSSVFWFHLVTAKGETWL